MIKNMFLVFFSLYNNGMNNFYGSQNIDDYGFFGSWKLPCTDLFLWCALWCEKADYGCCEEGEEHLREGVVVGVEVLDDARSVVDLVTAGQRVHEVQNKANQTPCLSDKHAPKRTLQATDPRA